MGEKKRSIVIIISSHSERLRNIGVAACEECPECVIYDCFNLDDVAELAVAKAEDLKMRSILMIIDSKHNFNPFIELRVEGLKKKLKNFEVSTAVLTPSKSKSPGKNGMTVRNNDAYVPIEEGNSKLSEAIKHIVHLWRKESMPFEK